MAIENDVIFVGNNVRNESDIMIIEVMTERKEKKRFKSLNFQNIYTGNMKIEENPEHCEILYSRNIERSSDLIEL